MSENFGVNPVDQASAQRGELTYTSLIEDHASQLMDELFQSLDCNGEPSAQQPSAASQLALAIKTDELQDNLLIPYVEMDAILEPFYEADAAPASSDNADRRVGSYLLLGLAWGTFLGSASLLGFTQFNSFTRLPTMVQATVPVATAQPQDVAFATDLSEVLQSTENILPAAAPVAAAVLPTVIPPAQSSAVPVALPPVTPAPSPSIEIQRKVPPAAAIKPQPPQTVALAALSNRLPVLSGGQTQTQTQTNFTPPNLPPSLAPQAMPMGRQAKSGVTVQGILDLGSKSAILISRNGSTQNVRPGEVLDATGWIFLRVENGQAILQRGNETRSVSGGEQF